MKVLTVGILICFILAFLCTASNAKGHDVTYGEHTSGEILLDRQQMHSESRAFRTTGEDYTFEQKNYYPKIITFVNVTDMRTDDTGGYTTLISGGPGFFGVKLHFASKFWRGFDFIVEVYGDFSFSRPKTYY